MRHLALFLFFPFALALTACSGGGGDSAGSVPTFQGKPRTFNGDWTGPGRAWTSNWQEPLLKFTLHISKTPEGADVFYNVYQADGSLYAMGRFVDHYAVGNILYSYGAKTPAGTIGADGFSVESADTGRLIIQAGVDGRLTVTGHLQYGPTQVLVEAVLKAE